MTLPHISNVDSAGTIANTAQNHLTLQRNFQGKGHQGTDPDGHNFVS
jgi:hypothetical protein